MSFLRTDRFISCFVVHPALKKIAMLCNHYVPILMYHSISDMKFQSLHSYYETRTSIRMFDEHMKFLKENGYSSIGLNKLPAIIDKDSCRRKAVVITFDDGYKDFLINAFPIMRKHGLTATVFLTTGMMGSKSGKFKGKETLDWTDVTELRKLGVEFGSHTVNHRILKKMTLQELEAEVGDSKNEIESHIGEPVEAFSYPYAFPEGRGDFLNDYFEVLNRCGYRFGVTTVIGRVKKGHNLLALRRIPVNEYDDSAFFKAKLEGGYDWVHVPQYLRKRYFGWIGE